MMNARSLWRTGLAATVLASLTLVAAPASAQQGVSATEIKIGGFGAITGPIAFIGAASRDGMQLAVDQINANGGINGRKLRLIYEAGGTPAEFQAAARKLVEQDQVFAVMIGSGSTGAAAAADYLREKKIPTYALTVAVPKYYDPFAPNMLSGTVPHAKFLAESMFRLTNSWGTPKNVALVVTRLAYHKSVADSLKPKIEAAKIPLSVVEEINSGARDMTAPLVAIAKAKPDVVVLAADAAEAGFIIKQAPEKGVRGVKWVIAGSAATDAFAPIVGKLGEGVRSEWFFPYYFGEDKIEMQKFEKAWKAAYVNPPPQRPNLYDLSGYNSMMMMGVALKRAGQNPTWDNVIAAFQSFRNVRASELGSWAADISTPETFGPKDIQGNDRMYQVELKNGKWVVRPGAEYVFDVGGSS